MVGQLDKDDGQGLPAAGRSAREQAKRSALAAAELRKRADAASKRSEAFAKGEVGEQIVAEALAPLSAAGCHILHDRFATKLGGNIDHLVVGPGGVLVVNAKHWKSLPSAKDGVLWCSGRRQPNLLARMHAEASVVSDALLTAGVAAKVTPVLVFTGLSPTSPPETVDGCKVMSPEHLKLFASANPILSVSDMDRALAVLMSSFPPASEGVRPPELEVFDARARGLGLPISSELESLYSRLYVIEWSRGSSHRLYVRAAIGIAVASKDVVTGQVVVEESFRKDVFAKALLTASGPADLKRVKLPELHPGGPATWDRVKHVVAKRKVELLVGWRWRKAGNERLYVHRLTHRARSKELGYVDLAKGVCVPTHVTETGERAVPSEHLLTWSWMGWHTPSSR